MAGRVGFVGLLGSDFYNRYHDFGHSGYFQNSSGQPDDAFMSKNWVPLLTDDRAVPEIDERGEATPLAGIQLTLLQWLDPVKMTVLWTLLGLVLLFLVGLWAEAALTRMRTSGVRSLLIAASERNLNVNSLDVAKVMLAKNLILRTNHVLWVDDKPNKNRLERRALRRWNICFTNVRSTSEAQKQISENPRKYKLAISDWARGAGDSGEHTALALLQGTLPRLPLIYYVSPTSVNDTHRARVKELGAIDQTGDPFTLAALSLVALSNEDNEATLEPQFGLRAIVTTGAYWLYQRTSACEAD
jgi:CheY-like chemotaxis protein